MERIKKSLRSVTSSIHQSNPAGGSESSEVLHHHQHPVSQPHRSLLAFYHQQRRNRPVDSVQDDGSLRRNWSHEQLDANSRKYVERLDQISASTEAIHTVGRSAEDGSGIARASSSSSGRNGHVFGSLLSEQNLFCPGSAHQICHPLLIHRNEQNQMAEPDPQPLHHGGRPAAVKRGIIHVVHNLTKSQSWTHLHLLGGARKRTSSSSLNHENGNGTTRQAAEETPPDKPKKSSATPDAFTGGDVISRVVLGGQYLPRLAEALARASEKAGSKSHAINKDVFVELLFGRARTLAGKIYDHLVRKVMSSSSHDVKSKHEVRAIPEKQFVSEMSAFARPALDADSVRLYLSLFVEDLHESNKITEMDFAEFLHCCYVSAAGLDGDEQVIDVEEGMVAIRPVLQTAFHRKTEVSTGYLQSWILRNCPRLILPLSTIVNDCILDAYVKLCCKQGVETAISSIPHDEERSHLPIVIDIPSSKDSNSVGFQIGPLSNDGISASVVPRAELWILSASLPGIYLQPHPVTPECPTANVSTKDTANGHPGKVANQQSKHGVLRKTKSDKPCSKAQIKFSAGPGKPVPDEVDIHEPSSTSNGGHIKMSPLQSHTEWNLLYDSSRHGKKLSDFICRVKPCQTPTVMLIFAEDNYTLCIGVDAIWRDCGSFWGGEDTTALLISPEYRVLTTGAKILCFNNSVEGFTKGLIVGEDPRNPLIKIAGLSFDSVDYRQIPLSIQKVVVLSVADESSLTGVSSTSEHVKSKHKPAAGKSVSAPVRPGREPSTRETNKEELKEKHRADMEIVKLGVMHSLNLD